MIASALADKKYSTGRILFCPLLSQKELWHSDFKDPRAPLARPGIAPRKPDGMAIGCFRPDIVFQVCPGRCAWDFFLLRRKEVIHPLVLEGIPCFDLTPITGPALGAALPCGLGRRFRALPALMV